MKVANIWSRQLARHDLLQTRPEEALFGSVEQIRLSLLTLFRIGICAVQSLMESVLMLGAPQSLSLRVLDDEAWTLAERFALWRSGCPSRVDSWGLLLGTVPRCLSPRYRELFALDGKVL
jgi:hypothetical protein